MKTNKSFILIALGLIALIFGAFTLAGTSKTRQTEVQKEIIAQSADTTEASAESSALNSEEILSERILGNANAPIKITEYSSLTCGHCANFHKTVFPELKEKYIDSGKAYLLFSDFPLNGPAVHASLAARCADQDQYFDMINELFETQDKWAFDLVNYKTFLKSVGEKYGLDEATFTQCTENKALQKAILDKRAEASQQHQINATPSFVINDTTKVMTPDLLKTLETMGSPQE